MVLLQLRRCCGIIAAVRRLRSDGRAAAARLPVHATVDTCHLVVTWHVPPCVLFALPRHGGHAHCPIRCYAGLSGCDRQVLFGLICFLQLCIQCSDYVDFRRNRGIIGSPFGNWNPCHLNRMIRWPISCYAGLSRCDRQVLFCSICFL